MTDRMKSESWDAIVIGGGPAGASSAAILAEYGHRVLVLEREKFPRYHIGESLIPFTYQPLERLGLIPKMKASGFVKKYSVVFISRNGKASEPFYFYTRYDRDSVAQTWQVLRSEFDQMLLDNAREKGAHVIEEIAVKELLRENGRVVGVRAQKKSGGVAFNHSRAHFFYSFSAAKRTPAFKGPYYSERIHAATSTFYCWHRIVAAV